MNVLVVGATGYLGRFLVKELKQNGYYVRVFLRDRKKLSIGGKYFSPEISQYVDDVIEGDVTKTETMKNICTDMDYVISTVGITTQQDGFSHYEVDYQGNKNILTEAVKSRVGKFMYIHVLTGHDKFEAPVYKAKEKFVNELQNSPVSYCIVKPTGYFSDTTEIVNMARKGTVYLIGKGHAQMNPIFGGDLARECVKNLKHPVDEMEIGGPTIYSYKEMAQLAFEVVGKREKIIYIPEFVVKGLLTVLKPFTYTKYSIIKFFYEAMTSSVTAGPLKEGKELRAYFFEWSNSDLSN